MAIYLFPLCLLLLFLSKQWLTLGLSRLIRRFGGGHHALIIVWSIIFLPGTVIHELSHFFFAILTGARTGKIEIFPEYLEEDWDEENRGRAVALGSVRTQRLNPVQGFLVGIAPFVVGLALLVWLASAIDNSWSVRNYYFLIFQGYLFFTVTNSFFPSWSDIRQTLPLVIIFAVTVLVASLLGFRLFYQPLPQITSVASTLNYTLLISSAVDFVLAGILALLSKRIF